MRAVGMAGELPQHIDKKTRLRCERSRVRFNALGRAPPRRRFDPPKEEGQCLANAPPYRKDIRRLAWLNRPSLSSHVGDLTFNPPRHLRRSVLTVKAFCCP